MRDSYYWRHREEILAKKKTGYKAHPRVKVPVPDGQKRCTTCGVEKEKTSNFFDRNRSSADGFHNVCKVCRLAYRITHKADVERRRIEWLARDPGGPKRWRKRIKIEMIEAYGGICVCCGEPHQEFLTLDHIGGRTEQNHPWSIGRNGTSIYGKLKKLGWPKDIYRLLCMNCNWAIRWGERCPHEAESKP